MIGTMYNADGMYDWRQLQGDVNEAKKRFCPPGGKWCETHVFVDMDNYVGFQFTFLDSNGSYVKKILRLSVTKGN